MFQRRILPAVFCLWLLLPVAGQPAARPTTVQDQRTTDTGFLGQVERGLNTADDVLDKMKEAVRELRRASEQDDKAKQQSAQQEQQPAGDDPTSPSALVTATPLPPASPADIVYPKPTSASLVIHVEWIDVVGPQLRMTIDKAVREAEEQEASLLLIELHTPGGRVDSAGHIKKALISSKVTTAIWVNENAISAGALIALSCDNIFMSPGATIGAATPMMLTPTGATTGQDLDIKEKMLSYVVTEFEAAAEAKGHRQDLAAAFVDRQQEIAGLIERGKLLVLTAQQAVDEGLAISVVSSREELYRTLKLSNPQEIPSQLTAREKFAITISTWAFICLGLGLVGIFFEIKSPGFGVPGIMGLFCLGLFFWANFVTLNTSWFEIILFFIGFVLIVLEVTVIPGFGVAGIAGIICVGLSFFLSMFEMPKGGYPMTWEMLQGPVHNTMLTLIIASVLMVFALRFFHQTPFWRRIELRNTLAADKGFVSASPQEKLIGAIGVSATVLRPSGIVTINRERKDALTQGDYLEKGVKVRVIGIDGAQLLVEEVK